ncbi:MAG: hypothetical protein RLZZ261_361 [Bacteroidota bacterium]|jgi:hypothetical protein
MKFLPFFALAALASCSIQLDSQYGLRLEPSPRGPRSDAQGELHSEIRESAPTTEVSVAPSALEAATALTLEFAPSEFSTALETPKIAEVESEATASITVEALNQADESIQRAETASSEWPTKKTAHTMTVAWVLWAIPAVLILAEFTGFALMFGAHWYYLGKMRRARTATFIWALTLAVFIVFRVFKALELSLLAGLVGLVGLLPLLVIMLYRLIADVILLSKISSKQARRALKTSRNRSRTAA